MEKVPNWLASSIIYQVFPPSFQDSNNDGIGDIPGITSRLDHFARLGITVIWISPLFQSPFRDAGYDVSDYFKIAPRYGTKEDFIELCQVAASKGIRVILDLVIGHTSDEHDLFKKAKANRESPEAGRYIWREQKTSESAGNSSGSYVSNFFEFQPALNFGYANITEDWQPSIDSCGPCANRKMIREIIQYWVGLGASGFRVDMASSLIKEDIEHRGNIRLWQELRDWVDDTFDEVVLFSEWSRPKNAIEAGFHLDFLLHFDLSIYRSLFFNEEGTIPYLKGTCYFHKSGKGSPWEFMAKYLDQLAVTKGKGLISIPSGSHDFQRLRCGSRDWEQLRVVWTFLLTQVGPPTIYMGDEIGMRFLADTPPKEGSTLTGAVAPNAGDVNGERSGARTPMQWDRSRNAGFSQADPDHLYLPIDPDQDRPDVQSQLLDSRSLFNFIRSLIIIRQSRSSLSANASYDILTREDDHYPLVILRALSSERSLIVLNPSGQARSYSVTIESDNISTLFGSGVSFQHNNNELFLAADAFGFALLSLD